MKKLRAVTQNAKDRKNSKKNEIFHRPPAKKIRDDMEDDERVHEEGKEEEEEELMSASCSSSDEIQRKKEPSSRKQSTNSKTTTTTMTTTTTTTGLPAVFEEEEDDDDDDEIQSKDFNQGSKVKSASTSSHVLEEELRRARREISDLTRANETIENENSELMIFLENFEKEMENERKKVSQAKEEIKQLTNALESSKESIQILSSDREQLSDQLEQVSKKLRVANRHVSISKEKEATLSSRHEEVRKLANRIDALLTDGYVAVAHDNTNTISKKTKKTTASNIIKNGIVTIHSSTKTLHNKNDDICASSYATMYSLSK